MTILREQVVYVLWKFINCMVLGKHQKRFWNSSLFSERSSIPNHYTEKSGHVVEVCDARLEFTSP